MSIQCGDLAREIEEGHVDFAGRTMDLFENSNQVYRIFYRFTSYKAIVLTAMRKGVPLKEMTVTKFPYWFKDNKRPCDVSIELGNICDLRCQYCNVPLFSRERGYMSDDVVDAMIHRIGESGVSRVRIGGGEPTLHPRFQEIASELAARCKFLSIVTNGQWKQEAIPGTLAHSLDLIEISVDAGGKSVYEKSRKGASYDLLMENIAKLKELRKACGSRSLINIRLMVRPSTRHCVKADIKRLSRLCDCVMPQFVLKLPESDYEDDVFIPKQRVSEGYPKCTLPFKDILIMPDGKVPYCAVTGATISRQRMLAGDIKEMELNEIWRLRISELRTEHRTRRFESSVSAYCKGCSGR